LWRAAHHGVEAAVARDDSAEIDHGAAFAILKYAKATTAKEESKIMSDIRRKAGPLLKCRKAGNRYMYDFASWRRLIGIIAQSGGVEKYIKEPDAPDPDEIARQKSAIRAARATR
jgi:hypothetical protein